MNSPPPAPTSAPAAPRSAAAPVVIDRFLDTLTPEHFAAALDRLGPFEPAPRLAVAVSGGADSTALALLAHDWARARGGDILALIVDHALRPAAAAEAAHTRSTLAAQHIEARVLTLTGLHPGPGLAHRARTARYAALTAATRAAGILHLLLAHHAHDQAETALMRARAGSTPTGLAGIAALREQHDLRLLRPLLDIPPARLRALLKARGVPWIEDPSNHDPTQQRTRLRTELSQAPHTIRPLLAHTQAAAAARTTQDRAFAAELAMRVRFSPWGWAILSPGPLSPSAATALWQALSGRDYPPPVAAIARFAAAPAPLTLAGLRATPAPARLGPGWLLLTERAPPPIQARDGAIWSRFRLHAPAGLPPRTIFGALGSTPLPIPRPRAHPAILLRLTPTLFHAGRPVAIPALDWAADPTWRAPQIRCIPSLPASGAPWCGSFPAKGCLTPTPTLC